MDHLILPERTRHASENPAVACDHVAVHAQLANILSSQQFRNSKRSQTLLRFVVDAALAGDLNSLKERCIGASVFGRDTGYDTAQDPVVRNAAIEVRKRLAQYYLDPEHASELRIDLPIGSYMPAFTAESPAVAKSPEPEKTIARSEHRSLTWRYLAAATVLLVIVAACITWAFRRTPAAELEAFWEPLFRDRATIQICIGQPSRVYRFVGPRTDELNGLLGHPASADRIAEKLSIDRGEVAWVAPEYLFLRDALSGLKLASWIQSRNRTYQIMSVSQADYSRLRHTPMVAVGAFNNPWSMRVTAELRFVFDDRTIGGVKYHCIYDRRNPNATNWKIAQPAPAVLKEDYAIVTRVFDPATEKTVISAAGIETFGTLAAGEFVTEPDYVGVALSAAGRDWRRKNVQFVLRTAIIDGTPGPPQVLATHFW